MLIKELFNGDEKAPLDKLREAVNHYDKAYYEIMNLSNDIVDFPLFRVMASEMKKGLGSRALKIKEALLTRISKYCKDTV